ncbi:PREDICTED: G-type lectin S-receptor-like serine/threonine-protein kinase At4g27290 [Nelumbo nucifera]|uniref:Apple domain-containing protein n=2 Tax=Nelumbo nucifera TaxID=4432 RepID=A0A822ZF75_NELNU|nr:PREDICTED: G-type lectin S-receptor-like serine/threonine-protein kinase At4g27290 [Nelumbo nucifera]DAD41656.1 TPA_asm: hypothetical protein HUJ06_015979 [Nelumbo nucifera]
MGTNKLLAWRQRDVYWKSGVWDGRSFKSVPELTSDNVTYNFSYVWSEDERYFTFSLKQNSSPSSSWVLDSEGNIRQYKFYNWNDYKYDSFNILCPTHLPYNYSRENKKRCVEKKVPECRRGELFYSKQGYMDGPGSCYTSLDTSLRLRDCADMCWSNCSCLAYKTYFAEETGCQL